MTYGKKDYENGSFIAFREPKDAEKSRLDKIIKKRLIVIPARFNSSRFQENR